jgi:hypothetical protein
MSNQECTMKQHIKSVPQSSCEGGAMQHALRLDRAEHDEQMIDQALMDTFPASDPVPLYSLA